MSVIVKDMEMPKNCEQCLVYVYYETLGGNYGCFCGFTKKDILNPEKINDWCPLVEIPKDVKLIDVNELLDKSEWYGERATYNNPMPDGEEAVSVKNIEKALVIFEEGNE